MFQSSVLDKKSWSHATVPLSSPALILILIWGKEVYNTMMFACVGAFDGNVPFLLSGLIKDAVVVSSGADRGSIICDIVLSSLAPGLAHLWLP